MSHEIHRRRRSRVESATYAENGLARSKSNLLKPVNQEYEKQLLILVGEIGQLNIRQALTRLCMLRGPWRPIELQRECIKLGRKIGISSVHSALHDLVEFGVLNKINGGYAIANWKENV